MRPWVCGSSRGRWNVTVAGGSVRLHVEWFRSGLLFFLPQPVEATMLGKSRHLIRKDLESVADQFATRSITIELSS